MKIKAIHLYYFVIIVVLILAAYLLLNNFNKDKFFAPDTDDKNSQEQKTEEENVPKVGVISGEVVSVENGYIEVKVNIYGNKEQIVKIKPTEKVVKKSGSYDKNGKFENISEKEVGISEVKNGEHISIILKNPSRLEDLEKDILESEYIGVSPLTNIELN